MSSVSCDAGLQSCAIPDCSVNHSLIKAVLRLNSTTRTRADPHGPARTLSETRTDPTEFLGDPARKKVRAGPVGPRVMEFSLYQGRLTPHQRVFAVLARPWSGSCKRGLAKSPTPRNRHGLDPDCRRRRSRFLGHLFQQVDGLLCSTCRSPVLLESEVLRITASNFTMCCIAP